MVYWDLYVKKKIGITRTAPIGLPFYGFFFKIFLIYEIFNP